MKKFIATLAASFLLLSLFGVSTASADPGPDTGNSEKGHCTAYFNGQKKGHDKQKEKNDEAPGPFADLEDRADEAEEEPGHDSGDRLEEATDVFEYCQGMIGGNREHGRFDCTRGDNGTPDNPDDDTYSCE